MNLKPTILLLILAISTAYSQNKNIENYEVGYYRDMNNQLIDEYYDIDYIPEKPIGINYNIEENFIPGYYLDLKNNKILGLIKYSDSYPYFEYKKNTEADEIKIHPTNCTSFVAGSDTFTVLKSFEANRDVMGSKIIDAGFAEIIDRFNNLTFYRYSRTIGNEKITYIVRIDSTNKLVSFVYNKKKYKEAANSIFGTHELLSSRISSGRYDCENTPTMIKFLKYKYKHDNSENIYFNSSWNEVDDINKSNYYAKINSIKDSIIHMSYYFNNGIPIYEGSYYSFCSNLKTGKFIWFYPNGKIRKTINYIKNEPDTTVTFFKNGNTHSKSTKEKGICKFEFIYTPDGKEVLNNSGSGIEKLYDSIAKREITNEYSNNKLASSYYTDSNNVKTYQFCSKSAELIKISSTKYSIKKITIPDNMFINDVQGILLFKYIIDQKGYTTKIELIKGLDSKYDSLAINTLIGIKNVKTWTPAKMNKEKVMQELILPVSFSFVGYRKEGNFNNMFMQDQMLRNLHNKTPDFKAIQQAQFR